MTAHLKNFKGDGSTRINNVYFRPVDKSDKDKALNDKSAPVVLEIDEEKFARYDAFNTNGNEFCGHLDMYYDRGGYMSFAEHRQKEDGNYEVRISNLPAGKLFSVFPKTRSELTYAMMQVAKEIHERNVTAGGWRQILPDGLQQRCQNQ